MSNQKQEENRVCITMCISRVLFMRVRCLYFLKHVLGLIPRIDKLALYLK